MTFPEGLLAVVCFLLFFYGLGILLFWIINKAINRPYESAVKLRYIIIIWFILAFIIDTKNQIFILLSALASSAFVVFKIINKHRKEQEQHTENTRSTMSEPYRKNITDNGDISLSSQNGLLCSDDRFRLHPDLVGLIWIADGKYRNYNLSEKKYDSFTIDGITIRIEFGFNAEEPSLIYTQQKVSIPKGIIGRPPYYPSYINLTPEQKWTYLQLLSNPYDTNIDIGYVFILYYGLERHLLLGDFDRAFNLILKLRDVHKNSSFQNYSANALILSSMMHKRGEKILDFIKSLDKEYEYNYSDNLFLMCSYSFNIPLEAKDIMRMAKTFEFSNTNYIKKYPDVFGKELSNLLFEKYGETRVALGRLISQSDLRKIKYENVQLFANMSIIDKAISVPMMRESFKLKKEMNILLEEAHSRTKNEIAVMRKAGTLKEAIVSTKNDAPKNYPPIDDNILKDLPDNAAYLDKHFHYATQIQAFYSRRDEDSKYLDMAIDACKKQISISTYAARAFLEENPSFILPAHTGYRQLCIILDKQGKYDEVISLAEKAKNEGWAGDWDSRIDKAKKRLMN